MDSSGMLIVGITILGGIGGALFFFGALFTVAAAFGRGDKLFGIFSILFLPLTIVYCLMYREHTKYPSRYVFSGLALLLITFILVLFLSGI